MAQKKRPNAFQFHILVFLVLVIFSGTILALSTGGFIVNFKTVGFSFLSAVQKGAHAVGSGITGLVTAVKDLSVLREEYAVLTQKLQDYEYLQRNNAEIRKENERLREQLKFSQSIVQTNLPALVIGRDPNSIYSGITINKGSLNGIKKNMPVIAVQNGHVGLVGKITTVGLTTSMVMPVYDYQCNVSSRIQTTRDIGIVSGTGSHDAPLLMKYIKKRVLEELQYGDIVVTSGENDNYLRDIPVGTISKISVLDYDTSLEIELTPIIDFSRLETVIAVDVSDRGEL